jgi:hypothetical protein
VLAKLAKGESMAARKSKTGSKAKPEWERTPREVEAIKKALSERAEGVPRLKVSKSENGLSITPEHPDEVAGEALLMEAIATTDADFLAGFVRQLAKAGGGEIDEHQLNFMLAVVKGIKPRDQLEAMLAAQMAAVHTATMKFSRSLAEADHLDHRDSAERTFNKLTRTYLSQMEALKRYRTGREQTVTVQHVNVSEGGQAIVGNVTQGQRDVVPNRVPAQPLALTHEKTLPMPIIESKTAALIPAHRNAKRK